MNIEASGAGFVRRLLLLSLVGAWSALRGDPAAQPVIREVWVEADAVVVVAEVPPGIRKLTLEGRHRFGAGGWQPRTVAHLDGQAGEHAFRLSRGEAMEVLRVRGDATDPLPAAFYRGTNFFRGRATTGGQASDDSNRVQLLDGSTGGAESGAPPGVVSIGMGGAFSPDRAVVESDIWRIRGDRLFFFNQYRGLQILDLSEPDTAHVRATVSLPNRGEEMYLVGEHHVALLASGGCFTGMASGEVILVDVAQDAPRVVARLPVRGTIRESRLVGTALYVAGEAYQQTEGGAWEIGIEVAAFDLTDPAAPLARAPLWFGGYDVTLSANDVFLFIASRSPENGDRFILRCLDITAPDGTLRDLGTIRTAGRVTDKFKLNWHASVLTAISEVIDWQVGIISLKTKLETFSLPHPASAGASGPVKLGELELGGGERLFGTRFDGLRAYVVTYRRTDPLWVVDLADPERPQIAGELHVPGWSSYLHPLGDRLVTMGVDDTNGVRAAVSLFDVRDPRAPGLLSRVSFGEGYSWSEANSNEKALSILPDQGLILVPYQGWQSNRYVSAVQIVDLKDDRLAARGTIDHAFAPRRATVVGDRIVSVSATELLSVDATDRDHPQIKAAVELAWSVDRVFAQGGFLLELTTSSSGNGDQGPVLRVVATRDPDRVLEQIVFSNRWSVAAAEVREGRLCLVQKGFECRTDGSPGSDTDPACRWGTLLSVYDLGSLPKLTWLGQAAPEESPDSYSFSAQMLWPKPGLLVLANLAGSGWWRGGPFFIDAFLPGVGMGQTWAPGPSLVPLPPWGWSQPRSLAAFDVGDPTAPRFLSRVELDPTNRWHGFSDAFAAGGLVFSSHQETETRVVGTNEFLVTHIRYETMTNVTTVTNLSWILRGDYLTNVATITNSARYVRNDGLLRPDWLADPGRIRDRLAAGGYHSLRVNEDETGLAWGRDLFGELGDGFYLDRSRPGPIAGLGGIVGVAGGRMHSLAWTADGAAWAWGLDASGQLGDGEVPPPLDGPPIPVAGSPFPVRVDCPARLTSLKAGFGHSLGLGADGQVWAWGANTCGQLGDGSRLSRSAPVSVPGLSDAAAIAAGSSHSLALKTDGTVIAWGANTHGQLGDTSANDQDRPVAVTGLDAVVDLAAGADHSLALRADGTVWAWGSDESGQLGAGGQGPAAAPMAIPGLDQVVQIAAGHSHNLALQADGTVWAWGRNDFGQLNAGDTDARNRPARIAGLAGVVAVTAGGAHSLAMTADGAVWAWGDNRYGQLGDGLPVDLPLSAGTVTNITTVTNRVALTNLSYITNVFERPVYTTETNRIPIFAWEERAYLDVIDYTDPLDPTVRKPVNIPDRLAGVSLGGALLFTSGWREQPSTNSVAGIRRWLDASAYDGVEAHLIDSLPVTGPWVIRGADVLHGRTTWGVTNDFALESWRLSDAGRFTLAGQVVLTGPAQSLAMLGDLLLVDQGEKVDVFHATDPASPVLIAAADRPGCVWPQLNLAEGTPGRGIWLPLGMSGTWFIPLPTPP